MIPEFAYFWKVNIAFMLLYAFYRLFFYKDTFFKLRRFILLSFFVIALIYPLWNISDWFREQGAMYEIMQLYSGLLPETVVTPGGPFRTGWQGCVLPVVCGAYWAGVALLLIRLLVQLSSLLALARRSEVAMIRGVRVHLLPKPAGPFSFFRLIFLYPASHSEGEIDEILAHECTHVAQWHSIDVLVSEWVCSFCWVNPFVWLLKREVRHNLEYLADDRVIESGYDSRSYQYHLLGLAHTGWQSTSLSNSFNMLHLKNRIRMMNKKRTPGIGRMKCLIFIPVVALLFFLANLGISLSKGTGTLDKGVEQASEPQPESVAESIFTVVELMPEFPGRQNALLQYLASNIRYPESAMKNGVQGRVSCSFVVRKDGTISDVEVIRGVDPELDAEAVRTIKSMPRWKPGKQKGQAVNVRYTVPVTFRLQ